MQFISFNHEIIPKKQLSFYDVERFRYADAVFESILMINQQIPLVQYHQNRINQACAFFHYSSYQIDQKHLLELINKNQFAEAKLIKIRLSLIRKNGHNYQPYDFERHCLIEVQKIDQCFDAIQNLGTFNSSYKSVDPYNSFKTTNSLIYVMAKQFASSQGFNDVLIRNEQNNLIEASSSNLFIIIENEIFTPSLGAGQVEGVMLNYLLDKYQIKQINVTEKDILNADEVFLSNGIKLIQPVLRFTHKELSSHKTKQLISDLKTKWSF